MKTIKQQWEDFEEATIHPEAAEIQRREMKGAFYAGWTSALGILFSEVSKLPEAEGEKQLARFVQELHGFKNSMLGVGNN